MYVYKKIYIYFNDCSSHSDIPPPPPTMRLVSIDSAHAKPPDARQGPWRRAAAAQQPGLEDVGIWRSGKDVWVCVKICVCVCACACACMYVHGHDDLTDHDL